MGDNTNEAIQCNLVYNAIQDFCFTLTGWNFARKTASLALGKTFTGAPWTVAQPTPPWQFQYVLPADYLKAQYITNNDIAAGGGFLGESKRFAIVYDGTVVALATNETAANLVYTSRISDPTVWAPWFERTVVSALAFSVANALNGKKELVQFLLENFINTAKLAADINRREGIIGLEDATAELLQLRGIEYPPHPPVVRPRDGQ